MAVRIQLRRDTEANWVSSNPTLRAGEIGIETDTLKFKIGNGSSPWNSITTYANVVPSDLSNTLNGYLEVGDLSVTVAELVEGNLYVPGTDIELVDTNTVTITSSNSTDDRTITLPDATTTLVGTDTTDTLTNKTLTSPVVSGLALSDASIVFEGAVADSYETTLTVGEPTADNTITLPDATGTVALTSNIPSTTDGLSEGTTNKYFTDERAQDAVAAAIAAGSHTNITISYDDNANSISFTGAQTYSDENAQDAVGNAVGNGLDYDDNTGAISVDPSEFALNAIGAPTGNVDLASYKITNLASPTSANDAANKAYVDNTTAGLNFHASVHCASTANLTATYDNGTGGVGATLTNSGTNEAFQLDNHVLEVAERVLIKDQTDQTQNGIYVVTTVGDGSTPWVLTRATDADNSPSGEVAYGDFTFVQQGTNGGYGYILTTTGTVTIGTTNLVYTVFNAGQTVIAGNGLSETTPGTLEINTAVTVDLNTAQTLTNKIITGTFTGNLTGNADTVTNGVYTNAANTITAASNSTKPLIIKGAASQSANLQEWQDSDGTVLASIGQTGLFAIPNATLRVGTSSSYNSRVNINSLTSTVSGIVIRGAASQTANLQEWQDSAGTVLARVDSSGNIYTASTTVWAGYNRAADGSALYNFTTVAGATYAQAAITRSSGFNGNLTISQQGTGAVVVQNGSASAIGLIVKGYASQTANLQEWQDSTGAILSRINNNGNLIVPSQIRTGFVQDVNLTGSRLNFNSLGTNSGSILLQTINAGNIGLIVRGTASQTANLQEWQNSSGTVLASINASGQFVGDGSQLTGLTTALTTGTSTLTANTATTISTTALSAFTSIEYMVSLKQGSKVRTSKVVMQTDGTSVDMTEFAITETGGSMTGVVISATTSGSDAVLQATVTDASSTNVDVKFSKVKL